MEERKLTGPRGSFLKLTEPRPGYAQYTHYCAQDKNIPEERAGPAMEFYKCEGKLHIAFNNADLANATIQVFHRIPHNSPFQKTIKQLPPIQR